jgi:stage IV sporulation protein FB
MNERLNWMTPSFEIARIRSVQIRVSLYFLLFGLLFTIRFGLSLGCLIFGTLLVSVILHEAGHVVLARLTGGSASEIHLTPLGGLAAVQPGRGPWAQLVTTVAGPFVNLTICLAVFPSYYAPQALWGVLNPLVFPVGQLHEGRWLQELGLVVFAVNWILVVINLLPILPLDGGRLVRILLTTRIHPELVDRRTLQISMAGGAILSMAGLLGDVSVVVFLGAALFVLNLLQLIEDESTEKEDDSFLGYDFSEGYTSLDRSAPQPGTAPAADSKHGLLERWRERRRRQREQTLRRQQEEAERQLDDLLAKVHSHGMNSLTTREQRLLRQVSDLLRERGKRPS